MSEKYLDLEKGLKERDSHVGIGFDTVVICIEIEGESQRLHGVVGHHVSLTLSVRIRSSVQTWVRSVIFAFCDADAVRSTVGCVVTPSFVGTLSSCSGS